MKNLYFLAAVAAFALGSCTVKEALDPPAGPDDEAKAIGFGTFLDRVPQNGIKPLAATVGIDELKGQGFMVEAYHSGATSWTSYASKSAAPNFMRDQTVTWSGSIPTPGTWTYSPTRYWPRYNTDWAYVHFFAYSPSTITFAPAATNKNPQLYFTAQTHPENETDLIVDAAYNVTHDTDNGKVTFKFDHILSRIGFNAQLQDTYESATVTVRYFSINYANLTNSGTYTFNGNTNGNKNNKAENSWEPGGTFTNAYQLFTTPASTATLSAAEPYNLSTHNNSDQYLMVIPQTITGSQIYVTLGYTIHYPQGSTPETHDGSARVYLPPSIWKPGIAYTYTLNMALNAVKVDVKESWDNWGNGGDIPIP